LCSLACDNVFTYIYPRLHSSEGNVPYCGESLPILDKIR
jgi:hypothetical protein